LLPENLSIPPSIINIAKIIDRIVITLYIKSNFIKVQIHL